VDARIDTADDPSTSDKHSVNFGPVTPELNRCLLYSTLLVTERDTVSSMFDV